MQYKKNITFWGPSNRKMSKRGSKIYLKVVNSFFGGGAFFLYRSTEKCQKEAWWVVGGDGGAGGGFLLYRQTEKCQKEAPKDTWNSCKCLKKVPKIPWKYVAKFHKISVNCSASGLKPAEKIFKMPKTTQISTFEAKTLYKSSPLSKNKAHTFPKQHQ